MVGGASTSTVQHAFLWDAQTGLHDLGSLAFTSAASGTSNAGHVVGTLSWEGNEAPSHPFLWKDGVATDLGLLGGSHGFATGVNSTGEVVVGGSESELVRCLPGLFCIYRQHAFVWSEGTMVDLGTPGRVSVANAINERGDIVGFEVSQDRTVRPVLWVRE